MTKEYQDFLAHYGVKGQKWGHRQYQNEDGSYNQAGAERYWGGGDGKTPDKPAGNSDRTKKVLIAAGGVALAGLASYGLYRHLKKTQTARRLLSQAKTANRFERNIIKQQRGRFGRAHTRVELDRNRAEYRMLKRAGRGRNLMDVQKAVNANSDIRQWTAGHRRIVFGDYSNVNVRDIVARNSHKYSYGLKRRFRR